MNKIIKKIMFGIILCASALSCENELGIPAATVKPVANFSATGDLFQANQKITFTDLSTDEDGFITSWKWDFGDSKSSTEQSPNHFYTVGGDYIVKLIVSDNTGSFSYDLAIKITIADDPLANIKAPEVLWSFDLLGHLNYNASPAVSDDGTVFIGFTPANREATPRTPNFFAIKGGALVWQQVLPEGGAGKSDQVRSSPAIGPNGKIYSSSYYSRRVFILNAGTGAIEGENNLDARFRYTSPTFATDGSVYIAGYSKGGRGFYSLNSSLSTINWEFKKGEEFNATPAIGADKTIYVGSNNDLFYAINPDGTEKWSAEYGTWTACAPAIGPDGTIYFSGESGAEGVLIAFNPADGTEKWRKVLPMKASHGGPAVAADGTVYLGGNEGKMIAYNPADGTEKWSYTAKGSIETVPAIDNEGNLYFGDLAGFFHILNPDGKNLWKVTQLGDAINSSVAIGSDGTIYVAVNKDDLGKVYALKTNVTGLQTGGWPMFAKDAKHTGR